MNAYGGHRVKGDGLEADEVVSRRDRAGDRGCPGAVLLNHEAISPVTVVDGAANQALLVNLEL